MGGNVAGEGDVFDAWVTAVNPQLRGGSHKFTAPQTWVHNEQAAEPKRNFCIGSYATFQSLRQAITCLGQTGLLQLRSDLHLLECKQRSTHQAQCGNAST